MLKAHIFEKKSNFCGEKYIAACFFRIIECYKPQRKLYKGPQATLTITVKPIGPFFSGPKRLLKTQVSEKKGNFSSEKKLWPIFSRVIECHKPYGTICKGPTDIPTITLEVIWSFLEHLRGCCKHKILKKKANLPVKKILWPIFSRTIECHKPQWTFYKGPKGILTITVEHIRAFFQDLRGCWKHKFLKSGNICSKKYIAACFFSYYRESQTLREGLWGCNRYSDNYSRSYLIISVTPEKLLKTQNFEKKRQTFLWKKRIDQFSRIFEYDKPHGTIFKGPQAILTNTLEPIREFFKT